MAHANPILLPAALPADSLVLGQLLTDPLNPYAQSFTSPHIQRDNSLSHSSQSEYRDVVSHDEAGRLVSSFSKRPLSPTQSNLLLLQADNMTLRTLKNPHNFFDSLRSDASAQAFMLWAARQQKHLYYVTGVQSLRNPTATKAVVQDGPLGTAAVAQESRKITIPIHTRRDSAMDLETEGSETEDAVFGLVIRKVKCRVGAPDEPHELDDIDHEWSYHPVDGDEGLQLSIGLGKVMDALELRMLAGLPSDEEDEDESERSWDSEDFEDEGLAGF